MADLLNRFGPGLLGGLRKRIPRDLQAKCDEADLLQDTLLGAHRNFDDFQGDSEQELLKWLRCLLRNQFNKMVRAYRRTAKRRVGREIAVDGPSRACQLAARTQDPCATACQREQIPLARQAFAQLTAREQEVVGLVTGERLSFPEVGLRLHITKGAARQRYLRARERFRELLEEVSGK